LAGYYFEKGMTMAADLQHAEFLKHLNTKFRIRVSEKDAVEAELTTVSEHLVSPRQERFSLLFRAPNEMFLGQGMRPFEHEAMGAFDLFIVPIERDDQGTYYEAVFNRMVKK
jgi:hypothetical protein